MIRLEIIKQLFKSAYGKMNVFIIHFEWKKAFIFLFFIFLSFVFWVLQSMNDDYETQIVVPIVYKLPPDMAFIDAPPLAITARIRDRGGEIINYYFKKIHINIDSERSSNKSGSYIVETSSIESWLMKQLRPTTSLIDFNPKSISISYGRRVKNMLPVTFDGDISTVPGYIVSGEIEFTPDEVEVYGADMVMDSLKFVRTEYTELKKVGKTVVKKLKIRPEHGITVKPNTVTVSIPVEEYTEKLFDIQIKGVDLPDGYSIRMFPASVRVSCNVPLSLFKELSAEDFSVEASYSNLEQSQPNILPLKVTKKPAWVYQTVLSHESIEFILEQNKL